MLAFGKQTLLGLLNLATLVTFVSQEGICTLY